MSKTKDRKKHTKALARARTREKALKRQIRGQSTTASGLRDGAGAELQRAGMTIHIIASELQNVLAAIVPAVELHKPVTKPYKGAEREICTTCRVLHPCKSFELLEPIAGRVETSLNAKLAQRDDGDVNGALSEDTAPKEVATA